MSTHETHRGSRAAWRWSPAARSSRGDRQSFLIGTLVIVVMLVGVLGFRRLAGERTDEYVAAARAVPWRSVEAAPRGRRQRRGRSSSRRRRRRQGGARPRARPTHGCTRATTAGLTGGDDVEDSSPPRARRSYATLDANAAAAGTTVDALEAGSEVTTTFLAATPTGAASPRRSASPSRSSSTSRRSSSACARHRVVEEKQSRIVEIIAARSRCDSCSRARCRQPALALMQLFVSCGARRADLHLLRALRPGALGPVRLVPRLLPRRVRRARLPLGRGRRARHPDRGPADDLDPADDAHAGDVLRGLLAGGARCPVLPPAVLGDPHADARARGLRRGGSHSSRWRSSSASPRSSCGGDGSTSARCSRRGRLTLRQAWSAAE